MSPIDLQDKIPGFRGSTTFFLSLQHNLSLTDANSPLPSPAVTPPPSLQNSIAQLPPLLPPSPLSFSLSSNPPSPDDQYSQDEFGHRNDKYLDHDTNEAIENHDLQPSLVTSFSDRAAALNLLSSSVAEQRVLAFRALLTYPLHLFLLAVVFFLLQRWTAATSSSIHTSEILWLSLAVLVGVLAAVACIVTLPYRRLAGEVDWDWLGTDEIVVAWKDKGGIISAGRYSDEKDVTNTREVVGVAVLAWRQGEGRLGRKGKRVGRGWIRGWTVCQSDRGHGVGRSLLEEAAKIVLSRRGDGLYFHENHAHSTLILPTVYSGPFVRRDLRAQNSLAAAWESARCSYSRRRSGGR